MEPQKVTGKLLRHLSGATHQDIARIDARSPNPSADHNEHPGDLEVLSGDPPSLHLIKDFTRWEMNGGGPLCDLGFDEQRAKRIVQDRLNRRLALYLIKEYNLRGPIILLSGSKIYHAVVPYYKMGLASEVLIVERKRKIHKYISFGLTNYGVLTQIPETVQLYPKTADIFAVMAEEVKKRPDYWKGFDIDLDAHLSAEREEELGKLIQNIKSDLFWLRLTTTMRPVGEAVTQERHGAVIQKAVLKRGFYVDDVASGPHHTYRDTAAMAVTQLICRRKS